MFTGPHEKLTRCEKRIDVTSIEPILENYYSGVTISSYGGIGNEVKNRVQKTNRVEGYTLK